MAFDMITERLKTYYKLDAGTAPIIDLENALKEMVQEIALRGLALSGFFKKGAFQGGTCLRVVHKMPRFSEDLDFTLIEPEAGFDLALYLKAVRNELAAFELALDVTDKSKTDFPVRKAFIKMEAVTRVLNVETKIGRRKKIRVKLEVDTNPPAGQKTEVANILWPSAFPVIAQDLPTLFAGKMHALLCRAYEKGRDWYDLTWYARRQTNINYMYLRNALLQSRDIGDDIVVDAACVKEMLKKKFESLNFNKLKDDIRPFVVDRKEVDLWTVDTFLNVIELLR